MIESIIQTLRSYGHYLHSDMAITIKDGRKFNAQKVNKPNIYKYLTKAEQKSIEKQLFHFHQNDPESYQVIKSFFLEKDSENKRLNADKHNSKLIDNAIKKYAKFLNKIGKNHEKLFINQ